MGRILEAAQVAHQSWVPSVPEDSCLAQVEWEGSIKTPVLAESPREAGTSRPRVGELAGDELHKFRFLPRSPAGLGGQGPCAHSGQGPRKGCLRQPPLPVRPGFESGPSRLRFSQRRPLRRFCWIKKKKKKKKWDTNLTGQ